MCLCGLGGSPGKGRACLAERTAEAKAGRCGHQPGHSGERPPGSWGAGRHGARNSSESAHSGASDGSLEPRGSAGLAGHPHRHLGPLSEPFRRSSHVGKIMISGPGKSKDRFARRPVMSLCQVGCSVADEPSTQSPRVPCDPLTDTTRVLCPRLALSGPGPQRGGGRQPLRAACSAGTRLGFGPGTSRRQGRMAASATGLGPGCPGSNPSPASCELWTLGKTA